MTMGEADFNTLITEHAMLFCRGRHGIWLAADLQATPRTLQVSPRTPQAAIPVPRASPRVPRDEHQGALRQIFTGRA